VDLRFLSPLFLIGLGAAAVPIVIHLFRRRADPVVPFATVRFLRRAPVEQARRRRLREWLLLALRTLALVLLALSFARPYLVETRGAHSGPATVIAMDTSYSVSAPEQVTRARALARRALDEAPADRAVALVAFDDRASVVVAPTLDRAALRAGITGVTPGPRGTRYGAAVTAAADVLSGRGGRLVVVSDLQRRGWAEAGAASLPPSVAVEAMDVGVPSRNLAVVSLQRTRDGITALVRNGGQEAQATRVTLAVDGRVRAGAQVTVQAGSTAEVPFALQLPPAGAVSAEVADAVGYAADNVRYAVLDAPPRPRVLAITSAGARGDSFYLERALAAAEGPAGMRLERATAEQVSAEPAAVESAVVIVLFSTAGLDGRASDAIGRAVEHGTGLLLVPGPSLDPTRAAAQLPGVIGLRATAVESSGDPLTFAPTDVRHPMFRAFGTDGGLLGSARFRRVVRWPESSARQILARFSNGLPAIVEVSGSRGHVVLLASDLANAWNDFALRPAFVPFAHDLLRYLAAGRPLHAEYRVGEWPGAGGDRPGVIGVGRDGVSTGVRRIAINVDVREADQSRLTPAAFVAAVPRANEGGRAVAEELQRDREREQSLWRYGLMLMLAGLVVESVVGRRA
jgi:Aerotolerance regulator N-terminal/von Willebrand factor type A domain